jgi:hypothetical protein
MRKPLIIVVLIAATSVFGLVNNRNIFYGYADIIISVEGQQIPA